MCSSDLANVRLKDYLQILRKYKMQVGLSTNGLMQDKQVDRSEERRVGKECRSRGAPDQ